MANWKRTTVTAALPYANGPVHIGHLAGVYIPADIYVRYLRLQEKPVAFICGSDEHGVPVTLRARKEGITVQEAVDKYHYLIKKSFEDFGIAFDVYGRTSAPIHHETSSNFFTELHDKDVFEVKESEQYFDPEAQAFLADRFIKGTCPVCGNENAYGDQCESCGSTLSPSDLKNPKSMLSGASPVLKPTKHWYLPLNKYEAWLRNFILEGHQNDWKSNVYGQCKSWIDAGLQPRAVTRDQDWGVPVPLDEAKGKVLYVWFDAPIGYISATRELFPETWQEWWKDKETRLLHFIGKDNIVFHCIIFPVMLHAQGSFIIPDNVPANEFLNLEGQKISTSRNWAVWLHEYLEEFPGKQDVLRYTLTATAPETKDNDFTWKDFQARNNNELVAILGNLVNRTIVLIHKYYGGIVPEPKAAENETDIALKAALTQTPLNLEASLDAFRFREALSCYMDLARAANKYLTDNEPWKKITTEPDRVATVLYNSLQICKALSVYGELFLPHTAAKMRGLWGENAPAKWSEGLSMNSIKPGTQLSEPVLLFTKIEDEAVAAQLQKLENAKSLNLIEGKTPPAAKETITYEQFEAMDIRVSTVLEAEPVPKTKKLMKLLLDTGIDKRTVVSGIAEHYKPEEVIGRQVLLLANLAPRELKGITSQGMILMAEDKDGKLVFAQPGTKVWNGASVK